MIINTVDRVALFDPNIFPLILAGKTSTALINTVYRIRKNGYEFRKKIAIHYTYMIYVYSKGPFLHLPLPPVSFVSLSSLLL